MTKTKTFSSEISQRYALALYDLSLENNQTEEFASNMIAFMKVLNSNRNLKDFIKNPTYSTENQKIVFDKILTTMNFSKIIKNFFLILIKKKRIFFVDIIIEKFLKLISLKKGEISANLISSKKIDNQTILAIEKEISLNISRQIKLNSKIDESLIGGVIIQIGSLMIDTSIKSRLQKYKKLMIEA